ncbi:hypothetical protein RYX36_017291 [Vicia faba]
MASTPTPPPNPRPAENHNHNHQNSHKRHRNDWSSSSGNYSNSRFASLAPAIVAAHGSGRGVYSSAPGSLLDGRRSKLVPEFSGRKSTRYAAKRHSEMPRAALNTLPHSEAANEILTYLYNAGNIVTNIDNVLISNEHRLWEVEDCIYMLKNFGNTGQLLLAEKCYQFIMSKTNGRVAKGKLTSAMIGTLGRLGEIDRAIDLFGKSRIEGYGMTVYTFSAMISACGRNWCFPDAV